MRGTKRLAPLDSNPDSNDAFRDKRIIAGSSFDVHRAESSQQLMETPQLDVYRAESSRQHVRALNTQFASWVQTQLKNHPDELWEDGVRDYLAHASGIMEKFSDIVKWLKANAAKGDSLPTSGFTTSEKKMASEINGNGTQYFQGKSVFPTLGATPWSFGAFSNSQSPVLFGLQNSFSTTSASGVQSSVPISHGASEDADGEDELKEPGSPSLKKSEEKGIVVVHEVKCKLYVKSSDPADKDTWKDKGPGQLCIKCKEGVSKGTKESKPTIVIRNDVGRLLLNALLYPGIKTNSQRNSLVAIFHTSGDGDGNGNDGGSKETVVARTFLIRLKTEEDRNKLAEAIQEYAPAS